MQQITIVYKNDTKASSLVSKLKVELLSLGKEVYAEQSGLNQEKTQIKNFKPDLVISVGGDGTLLYAARQWGLNGAPILGINMGSLGFLAETEAGYFKTVLKQTLKGNYKIDKRATLEVSILKNGQENKKFIVLNDVVINKGPIARIMEMEVSTQNSDSWSYRADGLIISTTTGSTAYNVSAGGPIVHPWVPAIIITPICPFALSSRPLVLPADFDINIKLHSKTTDAHLTADGQLSYPLSTKETVIIKKSEYFINLIVNPERNFLSILKQKLGWSGQTNVAE